MKKQPRTDPVIVIEWNCDTVPDAILAGGDLARMICSTLQAQSDGRKRDAILPWHAKIVHGRSQLPT